MNPLAWENQVTLDNDVVVSYWVLSSMIVDLMTARATVSYKGYFSEASFLAGKPKILERSAEIDFSTFDNGGQLAAGVIALVRAAEGSV